MKTRKGFTLVELLVILVIIGILLSAMRSFMTTAEVVNVISDLHTMKVATLMLQADSIDAKHAHNTNIVAELSPYTSNPDKITAPGSGYLFEVDNDNRWWVGFNLPDALKTKEVRDKLTTRARSAGIYGSQDSGDEYDGDDEAWMTAR